MIILHFTPQELAILDHALGDRPYKEVAPLIASINRQLQPQSGGNEGDDASNAVSRDRGAF